MNNSSSACGLGVGLEELASRSPMRVGVRKRRTKKGLLAAVRLLFSENANAWLSAEEIQGRLPQFSAKQIQNNMCINANHGVFERHGRKGHVRYRLVVERVGQEREGC